MITGRNSNNLVEQSVDIDIQKRSLLQTFMEKMNIAEQSVLGQGYYSEEMVEKELAEI